jgi:tetratricopeptide (TPR) repeat protein
MTEAKNNVTTFLGQFTAPIAGVISLTTTLFTFIKLFNDPKDAGILITILLALGVLTLIGVCLYYARFWQPEKTDQGTPECIPPSDDRLVKQQQQQVNQRRWIRRTALVGLVAIPFLCLSGFSRWQQLQNRPPKEILILVAEFNSTEDQNYLVTTTIFENLEKATEQYADVKVKRLDSSFIEATEARKEGNKQKASIVIWGSYGKTRDKVPISINFELLKKPKYFPDLAPEVKGEVRHAPLDYLDSLALQTQLSQETTYLTLITLGMSRYAVDDWDGAIARFTDALDQTVESVSVLDRSRIHHARGYSYHEKKGFAEAIADYTHSIALKPTSSTYYNRGNIYRDTKQFDLAIADYTQAIKLNKDWGYLNSEFSGLSTAYNNRGNAKYDLGDKSGAIKDFNRAIALDPELAMAYNNRGATKSDLGDQWGAIKDLDRAIALDPKDADAYYNRGLVYLNVGNRKSATKDFRKVLQLAQDSKFRNKVKQELKNFGLAS